MGIAEQLNQFLGKRVFISGHTGFKGSWLCYWLHSIGAVIKGFSLPPVTEPNLFSNLSFTDNFESITGNIINATLLQKELLSFQPDFIFHLAAQPLVRKSYKDPLETFQTNVVGTANILNAVRFLEKRCVCICITTDKVYQNNEWIYPYRENDRLGGYDPYSASKACSELVISSFTNAYFNLDNFAAHQKGIASARAGNVIGGGDWSEDRLVPDIVKALFRREEVIIRNPNAVRPWQHVMEPLFGYMQLALLMEENGARYSGAWNFGPQTEDTCSVVDLADLAVNVWGEGKIKVTENVKAPHEARTLRLDISKAVGELNWTPKMESAVAIKRTIDWYQTFYNGRQAKELMDEDLKYYGSLFN